MIKKRIIFALLYKDGFFFLSRNFNLQKVGNLKWLINNFGFGKTSNFIDELICLHIRKDPTFEDKKNFFKDIDKLRKKIFIPLSIGGGLRNIDDVNQCFHYGADKIVLNTAIYDYELSNKISEIYGEQSISIMIDYLRNKNKKDKIYINSGTKFITTLEIFFQKYEKNIKYGEIILNSIEDDGTGNGLDLKVLNRFSFKKKNKPILLMGGAGKPIHIVDGLENKYLSGIITSNLFNFLGTGLKESRDLAIKKNINIANFNDDNVV